MYETYLQSQVDNVSALLREMISGLSAESTLRGNALLSAKMALSHKGAGLETRKRTREVLARDLKGPLQVLQAVNDVSY